MTAISDSPGLDPTGSTVGTGAVRHAVAAARASAAFLELVSDDGSTLDLAAVNAMPREFVPAYRSVPVSAPLPCAHAFRSDEPVLLESNDDIAQRAAPLAHALRDVGDALAVLPVRLERRVVGTLALSFPERRRFDERDIAYLALLGDFCAQAVERARFAESLDRVEAERDQVRGVLDRLDDGVIAVGSNLRIELANAAASRLIADGPLRRGDPLPEPWEGLSLTRWVASLLASKRTGSRRETLVHEGRALEIVGVPLYETASALVQVRRLDGEMARSPRDGWLVERVATVLDERLEAITNSRTLIDRLAQALVSDVGARVLAATLDSAATRGSSGLRIGGIEIDILGGDVRVDGAPVHLTPSEFRLLCLLAREPERVFTRQQLVEHLWQSEYTGDGHACDTHISNLRRKIEPDPSRPTRLVSVRGVGYKLLPV